MMLKGQTDMSIREKIAECLASFGITYFGILGYNQAREINPGIIKRAELTPRSVIVFLVPYYAGVTENLSVYAASLDYHLILREITSSLISLLDGEYPASRSVGFGDHSPIDERHAALSLSLGVLGDNGLIINPEYGSYVFIGDVVTDIAPEELSADVAREPMRCEGCGKCKRACPTGILRGEGDSCLSAITQKKGTLGEEEIALMRKYNTVWGCDICSEVCPHNALPKLTPVKGFYQDRIEKLTKEMLDCMSDEEFSRRAFAWRGRRTVERNLDYLYGSEGKG